MTLTSTLAQDQQGQQPQGQLGELRYTRARAQDFPPIAKAYKEVSLEVREAGLLKRARWFYALLGGGILLGFAALTAGFILLGDSWFQLLIAFGVGFMLTQVAFIGHEAAHRIVLNTGPANDRLARVIIASVGMSYSWWDSKHSRHHQNPNRVGKDPDIEVDTIAFLEEDAAQARGFVRAINKRQGWFFFPLLTLEGLNLHLHGIRHLCSRGPVKGRWAELSMITARFILFYAPIFMFLPLGKAFAFSAVQIAVFGVYMGASFAPNHKGMPVIAHDAKLDFFTKQVRTSRNVSGGWWSTILFGGLNYQAEHHLFPSMARPYLGRASKIVKEHCERLNVPYTETTIMQSYAIVIEYLNRVGLAARDPFDCPAAAQFGRR
ncbi:fatty acid desaturase [Leucobacter exalbidus]|uniref:Fatty acid desaturase n=1 Tax=Leucobacter exalbidus TaxID=662960 RepID=A0A940T6N3_9MICO|nr:acyl-CoA desaturase [Leucobacter exalbidus]MBP1327181.1 fatty acid desaturase [Leucobacter exalbidus]